MAEILDYDDKLPWIVSEVICIDCKRRFICGRPEELLLKNLECECGKIGYIIETGEDMSKIEKSAEQQIGYRRGKP